MHSQDFNPMPAEVNSVLLIQVLIVSVLSTLPQNFGETFKDPNKEFILVF